MQTVPVLSQFHVDMVPGQAVKLEAARCRLSHLSVTLCSYREVNKSTSKRANSVSRHPTSLTGHTEKKKKTKHIFLLPVMLSLHIDCFNLSFSGELFCIYQKLHLPTVTSTSCTYSWKEAS